MVGNALVATVDDSVPCSGNCVTLNVRFSGDSRSAPDSVIGFGVSSFTTTDCGLTVGGSFSGVTGTSEIVAAGVVSAAAHVVPFATPQLSGSPRSVTVYVKLSGP